VKAGEDFAKLAKEFSEDRTTKESGGLYENIGTGVIWKEVEEAALKLEKGQLAAQIIESGIGVHVVRLEDKNITKRADGSEEINLSVRHILLQRNFEEPGEHLPDLPPPFMTAGEIAKSEIEKEKRAAFVSEIINRNPVSLPEDFTVELPETMNKSNSE